MLLDVIYTNLPDVSSADFMRFNENECRMALLVDFSSGVSCEGSGDCDEGSRALVWHVLFMSVLAPEWQKRIGRA